MLIATAVPAYAASVTQACVATAVDWEVSGGAQLYHSGNSAYAAGTNAAGAVAYPTVARSGGY